MAGRWIWNDDAVGWIVCKGVEAAQLLERRRVSVREGGVGIQRHW